MTPGFRAVQLEFAAHIRSPDQYPKPADVDERRMRVYRELVYNNIEGFLAGAFPIAKKLLSQNASLPHASADTPEAANELASQERVSEGPGRWHTLVRQFVHQHASSSPYFLEISQEFLEYLGQGEAQDLPPFVLELCHYEWVELALRVEEQDIPSTCLRAGELVPIDPLGDLLEQCPVVSPLAKPLAYNFAVHRVRRDMPASSVARAATYLVVYRDPEDAVCFLEINAATTLLIELLDGVRSGAQALAELATRLSAPKLQAKVLAEGARTLQRLRERSIILGTLPVGAE